MKSIELRIGNKVQADGDIYTVLEIYEDQLRVIMDVANAGYDEVCIMHITNAKPIPLTAQLLEKCGFEYFKDNNSWQLDINFGCTIWGRINDGFNLHSEYNNEMGQPIHYLHQLQNIIHALTNTELTIKL